MELTLFDGLVIDDAGGTTEPCGGNGAKSPSSNPAPANSAQTDLLRRWVRKLDGALRRIQGVREFSARPDCLLRIAVSRAGGNIHLVDGTDVREGAALLDLHLWNEHLSTVASYRNGFRGAVVLRRQILASLSELACHIQTEPALGGVMALRARTAFVTGRRQRKLLRIARAFGFDTAATGRRGAFRTGLRNFWENFFVWALTWTFNPAALRRNGLLRHHCELWVSRTALVARYGRSGTDPWRDVGGGSASAAPPDDPFSALRPSLGISEPSCRRRRALRITDSRSAENGGARFN